MELAVIILKWNAVADTIQCVRQISEWQEPQPAIIVVDNASGDNSPEVIRRACPRVHLICNKENLGFAGGNNRGIQTALEMGAQSILLLNNDAAISHRDALKLIETLNSDPRIGCVGPLLFDADNRDRLLAAGSKNPARHHTQHNVTLSSGKPVQRVECIPGTAILCKAEVFQAVGLLDERYFFSIEIADLCLRASKHGFVNAINTEARAFHTLERSSPFRQTLYPYYTIRNRFLLIRKLYPNQKLFFFGFWTCYSLALSLKVRLAGQSRLAQAIVLGLKDGLQGRFGNQNERVLSLTNKITEATTSARL
ncbi:MAG: glycosyltransferase family 2 protein [Anaerolineae bacterium]|nr:glycosyltransferase family 2 protein [Anaerolineae bacterium]